MATPQNNHPLPTPPGQQTLGFQEPSYQPAQHSQRPVHKSRRSRGLSFRSDHSSGGKDKESLVETHREKEAKRLHTKADPTMALSEIEPGVLAAQSQQTMDNLRTTQHTDLDGNVITDPDQSNPTRWRMERPLDTIRSFEAAIRKRDRSSMMPPGDNESVMSYNNRGSFYGGNGQGNSGRFQHTSYYSASRPQSGAWDQQQQPPQGRWGPPPDRRRYPPVSQYGSRGPGGNPYPGPNAQGEQRSYETVASGSGTSGERPGYVTDPTSSDNSSIDRRPSPQKRQPEPVDDYGIGFSQATQYQPPAFAINNNGGPPQNYQGGGTGPTVAVASKGSMLRKPIQAIQEQEEKQKKRKSWFSLKGNRN